MKGRYPRHVIVQEGDLWEALSVAASVLDGKKPAWYKRLCATIEETREGALVNRRKPLPPISCPGAAERRRR